MSCAVTVGLPACFRAAIAAEESSKLEARKNLSVLPVFPSDPFVRFLSVPRRDPPMGANQLHVDPKKHQPAGRACSGAECPQDPMVLLFPIIVAEITVTG